MHRMQIIVAVNGIHYQLCFFGIGGAFKALYNVGNGYLVNILNPSVGFKITGVDRVGRELIKLFLAHFRYGYGSEGAAAFLVIGF